MVDEILTMQALRLLQPTVESEPSEIVSQTSQRDGG